MLRRLLFGVKGLLMMRALLLLAVVAKITIHDR
jgi:hypothetical protein